MATLLVGQVNGISLADAGAMALAMENVSPHRRKVPTPRTLPPPAVWRRRRHSYNHHGAVGFPILGKSAGKCVNIESALTIVWSSRRWPTAKPGPCSRSTIRSRPLPICCQDGRCPRLNWPTSSPEGIRHATPPRIAMPESNGDYISTQHLP